MDLCSILAIPEAGEEDEFDEFGGAKIPGDDRVEGMDLDDQRVQLEIGIALPEQLMVNDVVLTLESPLRQLRAACAYMELVMAKDLAAQGRAFEQRIPLEQVLAKEPTAEEKRQHELTHLPFAPWCPSRIKHRSRSDRHRRTVKAAGSGAYGEPEEADGAQEGVAEEWGALLLVAVCSETGYLMALPLKTKNQMSLITHELMAFTQVLGHEEVQYYSDNEPTSRQLLRLLVAGRSAAGLKTTMRSTKIYDSAGNSLVENAIQRVRSLAATLMESLAERIDLRFGSQHPIWSWACRHSAWLLNRFAPFHGSTSYELTHGRSYTGKMCPFGEVCFAYTKQKQGYKADQKWKVGICLGKTELQDNWVVGDANRVFLSRSLRRVANASKQYLSCFQGFTAYSWEYQQNFGGRIVPSKRLASIVGGALSIPAPEKLGINEDDKDALEVLAFTKTYAGKMEEARDLVSEVDTQMGKVRTRSQERKLAWTTP